MKHLDILKQGLEESLSQLKAESNIEIRFKVCMHEPGKASADDFVIHSVNGYTKPCDFYNRVYFLFASHLSEARKISTEVSKETRVLFMQHVKEDIKSFQRVCCQCSPYSHETAGHSVIFNQPGLIPDEPLSIPRYALDRVLYLTKEYAISWNSIVDEFISKIKYLSDLDEYTTWSPDQEKPGTKQPKLPLKMTVAQFAVFIKACMDPELFDVPSVAELTRILPSVISTIRTSDISPKSLRNHMESVSIEDVDYTISNLQQLTHNLRLLRNRVDR